MMHSNFNADNRLFGKVLREEMASHGIKGDALAFCAKMQKQRVYDV